MGLCQQQCNTAEKIDSKVKALWICLETFNNSGQVTCFWNCWRIRKHFITSKGYLNTNNLYYVLWSTKINMHP